MCWESFSLPTYHRPSVIRASDSDRDSTDSLSKLWKLHLKQLRLMYIILRCVIMLWITKYTRMCMRLWANIPPRLSHSGSEHEEMSESSSSESVASPPSSSAASSFFSLGSPLGLLTESDMYLYKFITYYPHLS